MKQLLSPSREYRIQCHAFPYVLAYCGPDRSWVVTKLTISQTHPATVKTVTRTLRSLAPLFLTVKAFTATRRTRTFESAYSHSCPFSAPSLSFCRAVGELLHRTLFDFRGERSKELLFHGAFCLRMQVKITSASLPQHPEAVKSEIWSNIRLRLSLTRVLVWSFAFSGDLIKARCFLLSYLVDCFAN